MDSNLVNEGRSASVLGVVDTLAPQLSSESCIGPCEVWGGSGVLVFTRDSLDKLITLGGRVRLDVTVVDQPSFEFGIVPAREDGRLGGRVVLV